MSHMAAILNASHFNGTFSDLTNSTPHQAPHAGVGEGGIFSGKSPLHTQLSLFLVQATIIITISRLIHLGLAKLRQPRVIAEVIGGICLGPSVLGNIPGFTDTIFPKTSLPFLTLVSNIGLVLYLFLVGLELDPKVFFGDMKKSLSISLAGIILPFCLGLGVSYGMYHYLLIPNTNNVPFTSFMLFTGVAMAITAFPVLARILTEFKLLGVPVGMMTISAAAIDDACSWTILALVVSILNAGDNLTAMYVFLVAVLYALILLIPVRLLLQVVYNRFFFKKSEARKQYFILAIFIFIFMSAWATELIGIHAIFGAFLVGLAIPRGDSLPIQMTEKIEDLVAIVFLPLFFASSGLKTSVGLLNDAMTWMWLVLVILISCSGKIFGCTFAAKLVGIPWRESWSIGILMNTKGLVELIVLNIGLEAQVINPKIFTIMVMMALVTTFMTSPIISFLYPPKYRRPLPGSKNKKEEQLKKEGHFLTELDAVRLLVYVDSMQSVPTVAPLLQSLNSNKREEDKLVVNALKIIETNERSSSILVASQVEAASQSDPALQVASFIGNFINVQTNTFIATSPMSGFGEEVNRVVYNQGCNLVLIPWHYGSRMYQVPEEVGAIIRQAGVTTAVYINWKADNNSWFTQVNQGFTRGILVPFIGGIEDREALKVAIRLQRCSGANLSVIHLAKHKDSPPKLTQVAKKFGFEGMVSFTEEDTLDDVAALEHVKTLAQTRSITLKAVETKEILEKATVSINLYDIIIVGRSSCTADDAVNEQDDSTDVEQNGFSKDGGAGAFRRSISRKMSGRYTRQGSANPGEIFGQYGIRLSKMASPVLIVSKASNVINL
uniref:Cation/H+ exchanger domain-containing protein n=1 Tax=Plectus sambesii TaxID=2011161 RepID=A0A914W636_9BILA